MRTLFLKALIALICLLVLGALTVTFLQFGPMRYWLLVLTMALPFAISLKDVKVGIYLLVFLTPIIDVFYYKLNVPYSSMLSVVFLSVFLGWLVHLLTRRDPRLVETPLNRPVMALGGVTLLSLAITSYKLRGYLIGLATGSGDAPELGLSVFRTAFILLCGCGFFFLFVNIVREKETLRSVLGFILAGGFVVGILGLVEYFGKVKAFCMMPVIVEKITVAPPSGGLSATFPNPNILGNYTILLLGLILGLLFVSGGYRRRAHPFFLYPLSFILAFSLSFILFFCLIFSVNRSGWFGFGFALFLGVLLMGRNKLLHNFKEKLTSVAFVLYFLYASISSTDLLTDLDRGGLLRMDHVRGKAHVSSMLRSLRGERLRLWKLSVGDWLRHPVLGTGIGTYSYYQNGEYYGSARKGLHTGVSENPHNYYLWLLSEMGIVAFLCFGWVISRVFRHSFASIKGEGRYWGFILTGMLCGLGGYLFALLGDHTLGFLPMQFVFWSFVGAVMVLGGKPSVSNIPCL